MVQAIHSAVKGRARYKVKELYRSNSLQQYLERSLAQQAGILKISASSLTGNVLVNFNPDKSPSEIASIVQESVFTFRQKGKTPQKASNRSSKAQLATEGEEQRTEDWHLKETESVLEIFQTSTESGLSSESAEENLNQYGPNALAQSRSRSDLSILLDQFQSLPVALLGAAAAVSLATGGIADALAIAAVTALNATIGFTTESQSEKIIRSLQSDETQTALVVRDDNRSEVSAEDVVVGDLLVLQAGTYVAADARLIETHNLSVDESALTGESIPVTKNIKALNSEDIPLAERVNMVYKGTFVTGGEGLAVVVATGRFTEIGKIQGMVSDAESTGTPLQKQLDEVGSQLVLLGSGICGFVFGAGLLRGYGFLQMLKSSISLAVASVPEGLPTIATTTLALGIQDMRKRHILIRGLNAVEALGSVQTICLDKTGTITQNKMVVEEVRTGIGILNLSDEKFLTAEGEKIDPKDNEALFKLLQVSVLCSESEVSRSEDGKYEVEGSATENALIYMAIAAGIDILELRENYPLLETIPRAENRNVMTTLHQTEGRRFVAVKGSPAEVSEKCTLQMKNNEVLPLTDEDKQALELENERMAGKALRVLGVAYRDLDDAAQEPEKDLIWLGLTGMADPIREGVPQLMEKFHQAGIDTVMITGDQSPTAYAIAKQLNLSRDRQLEILDSSDINNLEPEKMQALCDKVDVFARISPADKLQIVQALQASGKQVAMTGDGINDTPALKAADVGVAMGSGAGKVVHEVADVVVEDDQLETMIDAVSRGRTIYDNIRKSVHFLLSTNISEITVATVAVVLGLGEPLNTMQLLWLNLVSDVFPGLALAMEPPEPDILNRPPRDLNERIVKPSDFERIAFESAVISASALGAYGYGLLRYGIGPRSSTIIFMSLTGGQILHTISCRSEQRSLFDKETLPPNPYVDGAVVGSFALQLLPLVIPGLRGLLKLSPLDPLDWLVIASSALLPLVVNEVSKKDLVASEAGKRLKESPQRHVEAT